MQSSERARELERVYQQRRGHAPQISISDDSHHVTEAIGDMYGHDEEFPMRRNSRPLSFISNPHGDSLEPFNPFPAAPPKSPLRAQMNHDRPGNTAAPIGKPPQPARTASADSNGQLSPTLSTPPLTRTNSDTATQQFPLHDLDYESSPAGLAQELSNLQAIRRMSMDVNTADPDLPSFQSFNVPAPPQHFSEDEDPSKLFWVPARLHPELAPKEFKTFIEEKVDTIRRRSGDSDSLSPEGALGREGSGGGLRRKKSMLSRQIDSGSGYRDGAERLERKRSGAQQPNGGLPQLQELENIVEDPVALVRRMSIDAARRNSGNDQDIPEDVPILPGTVAGPGSLKRSTRTNYRRGSIRKGERVPFSRRAAVAKQAETDTEESPTASPVQGREHEPSNLSLTRVQSEPSNQAAENFSRPTRVRSPPGIRQASASVEDLSRTDASAEDRRPQPKPFHSRIASNGRTTANLPGHNTAPQLPQIIATPPPPEPQRNQMQLPERNSSRQPPPSAPQPQGPRQPPQQQQRPPQAARQNKHAQAAHSSPIKPGQSMDDLVSHPSSLPGNSTRTDSLSIIPNLVEEKKPEKKHKDKKDGSEGGSRKTSWGWLLGSDDKERDKKEKEDKDRELAKKVKNKLSKTQDKGQSHDDTRLDVLQTSIQGSNRGRESVVIDRESVKLEEERKKESSRKSTGHESKKEKESGLFSSIFGGGKKKGEKESHHKKGNSMRGLSPEPPPRILKPDIDYNWTRFSILEERAIYRMAHIKLANPRRELYSQVLLSNFMYSYLAKVQQMHPQIQIGTSAQAKQQQQRQAQAAAQQKKEQEQQPEEYSQYQRYQQV
ncbi:hypothetical protein SLS60_001866 [Paraconiothyrium brasiliense]|uniref:Protein Zds1 C-terminal domain-containing protein n=1 Tax=Paraconiothyrium brasiliense TaxID=300254 RepID=A0ABR3S0J4_9PLEO